MRLRFPRRSAAAALDRWREEGGKLTALGLRRITRVLVKAKRYEHAFEVFTLLQSKYLSQLLPCDHAIGMKLTLKFHGLDAAKAYFEKLQDGNSKKGAALPLLQFYVRNKDILNAESLMAQMQRMGLLVSIEPFLEMMKLYIRTNQSPKVNYVIQQIRHGKIPPNVVFYNLRLNASWETSCSIHCVEEVYWEMLNNKIVNVGWSTYATLANIYTKAGMHHKALSALRTAEGKLSAKIHHGYSFLITLYANLSDKDGVLRVWEASKRATGRITCANYMCIILSLLKIDEVEEAERVFTKWEAQCRKYDVRVSNVLLGAFVRKGWIKKAESLHAHTLQNGGIPNYKTWEILMEGWVKAKQMDKAVDAMKNGFSRMKCCPWRPSPAVTMAFAEYFKHQGDVKGASKYLKVLRKFSLTSLPLYKAYIQTHIHAKVCASNVLSLMEKDQIDVDQETLGLVSQMSKFSNTTNTCSRIGEDQSVEAVVEPQTGYS